MEHFSDDIKPMKISFFFLLISALFSFGQVQVIYGDDCTNDPDCPLADTATLFKLADRGEVNILAMYISSTNIRAAPTFKIMATYYKRPAITIGTFKGTLSCSNGCNISDWNTSLVGQYDPGDTSANYPDAIAVVRTALAGAANNSVVWIELGQWTVLNGVLQSTADGISPLTGAALIKAKVKQFEVCCGENPSGSEYNYVADPSDTSSWFNTVTSQNGYPPVWMIADGNATGTNAGPPSYAVNTVSPGAWVATHGGASTQRPIWGSLQILHAVRGLSFGGTTYFSDAGNGTQTVNASTGANSWSTGTASGHHYLNNVASTETFNSLVDGLSHGFGFAALPPGAGTGSYVSGSVTITGGGSTQ